MKVQNFPNSEQLLGDLIAESKTDLGKTLGKNTPVSTLLGKMRKPSRDGGRGGRYLIQELSRSADQKAFLLVCICVCVCGGAQRVVIKREPLRNWMREDLAQIQT